MSITKDTDAPSSAPRGNLHMQKVINTPTLFALYAAVKELGEVVCDLGVRMGEAQYKSRQCQEDA